MPEPFDDAIVLPPRRETFLAHYPRNFKLFVSAVLFALVVLPPAVVYGYFRAHPQRISGFSGQLTDRNFEKWTPSVKRIATDVHAPALNDPYDRTVKLIPAPDARVTEDTVEGSLPRISSGGIQPWQLYARPFDLNDKRPRLAIVVTDLGMARTTTDRAISQLPPAVTLSFEAQGPVVAAWGTRARQQGHEILLQIPVEPFDYPRSDPGPDTLLINLSNSENILRLLKTLRRGIGYVGVTTTYASPFTSSPAKFDMILKPLQDRGLMVLDSRMVPRSVVTDMANNSGVPVATATLRLDSDLAPDAIAAAFNALEEEAIQNGRAVGITSATPLMLSQLDAWIKTLQDRGIALAPLSAMVQ